MKAHRPFTAVDDAELRHFAALGYGLTMAARLLRRNKSTVSGRAAKLGVAFVDKRRKQPGAPALSKPAAPDRVSRMLAEWRQAAPVELAPRNPKVRAGEQAARDLRAEWLTEPWRRNARAVIDGEMR